MRHHQVFGITSVVETPVEPLDAVPQAMRSLDVQLTKDQAWKELYRFDSRSQRKT